MTTTEHPTNYQLWFGESPLHTAVSQVETNWKDCPSEQAHGHRHHAAEPIISERWKWITVGGNLAAGVAELATGKIDRFDSLAEVWKDMFSGGYSNMSLIADGLHNVGDAASYYMQAENVLNKELSEQKRQRMRKISYWLIAASSLGISAKAGVEIPLGGEEAPNPLGIYTAGASLALSGLLLASMQRKKRKRADQRPHHHHHGHDDVHEHDLAKHFWKVDIPSASLAVAGAALQKYNVDASHIAAIISGGVGAWAFRPTKKNLDHDCMTEKLEALSEPMPERGKHRKPKRKLLASGNGKHRAK